jgi:uncharacterized protein
VDPWISLITLGVRDIERSRRFYRDGLDWPESAASAESEDVAFFETGGVVLALYKRELLAANADLPPQGSGFAGFALAHNVATRELVDAALEAAVDAGGTVLKRGTEAEWGGYTRYFADADGFLWEVAWNPSFPLREDGSIELPEQDPASRSRGRRQHPRGLLTDRPTHRLRKACTTEGRESLIPPFSSQRAFPLSEEKVTPSGWRAHFRVAKY